MQEDHNVTLAFDYAQSQAKPAISPELAEWVKQLAYNESTDKSTRFIDALEMAQNLSFVPRCKIVELSKTAASLPDRSFTDLVNSGGSTSFHAPLEKDVRAFIDYHGDDDLVGIADLKRKYRQRELDPQFEEYGAAHIDGLRCKENEKPYKKTPDPYLD